MIVAIIQARYNPHLKLINSHIPFDECYTKSLEEDKITEKNHSD